MVILTGSSPGADTGFRKSGGGGGIRVTENY